MIITYVCLSLQQTYTNFDLNLQSKLTFSLKAKTTNNKFIIRLPNLAYSNLHLILYRFSHEILSWYQFLSVAVKIQC